MVLVINPYMDAIYIYETESWLCLFYLKGFLLNLKFPHKVAHCYYGIMTEKVSIFIIVYCNNVCSEITK